MRCGTSCLLPMECDALVVLLHLSWAACAGQYLQQPLQLHGPPAKSAVMCMMSCQSSAAALKLILRTLPSQRILHATRGHCPDIR